MHTQVCDLDQAKFHYAIRAGRRLRGGVEPWLMARWKARVEFLLSVINVKKTLTFNK